MKTFSYVHQCEPNQVWCSENPTAVQAMGSLWLVLQLGWDIHPPMCSAVLVACWWRVQDLPSWMLSPLKWSSPQWSHNCLLAGVASAGQYCWAVLSPHQWTVGPSSKPYILCSMPSHSTTLASPEFSSAFNIRGLFLNYVDVILPPYMEVSMPSAWCHLAGNLLFEDFHPTL